jgi:hypothetical protein
LSFYDLDDGIIVVKDVFGALAIDLALGFGTLRSVPIFGILAGITEPISTKHRQQQRYEDQQGQPSEHFFVIMHCLAPCLACIYPDALFSSQGII